MKTHRRLALALLTLVAPLSLAAEPRPPDSGTSEIPQSGEPRERAADVPKRAPVDGKDLERRVQALESEVAHLRSTEEAQNQQFGEPVTAP
jgi:TolA-binding protein